VSLRIYVLFFDDECLVFSLPNSEMFEHDDMTIVSSLAGGKMVIQMEDELVSDLTDDERIDLSLRASKNHGHDLICPLFIPKMFDETNNFESIRKIVEMLKSLNSESFTVKELYLEEVDTPCYVLTIS